MDAFIASTLLVALAEIGDKTQLLSFVLAARLRRPWAIIAGILARRIVSWVTLGDELQHGQLYGMIKFGSCAEIYVRDNVEITVKKGQKVRAGKSVIGRIV